jgi:hypothetical protein
MLDFVKYLNSKLTTTDVYNKIYNSVAPVGTEAPWVTVDQLTTIETVKMFNGNHLARVAYRLHVWDTTKTKAKAALQEVFDVVGDQVYSDEVYGNVSIYTDPVENIMTDDHDMWQVVTDIEVVWSEQS